MKWRDKYRPFAGRRRKIAYGAYLAAAALFFLLWRFPGDAMREFAVRGVKRINPHVSLGIGAVRPGFPPGVKFKDVAWSYDDDPVIRTEYIRLRPGWLSIFGGAPRCYVKAGVYGGVIRGDCRIMQGGDAQADLQASGLKLENVDWVNRLTAHRFTGRMNGNLKLKSQGGKAQTDSHLVFSDITVALAAPVLGIQSFQLDTVEADLSATPRRMEIRACAFKGREVEGEFTGDILITQPYQNSVLNLNGFLKPQASFLKQAGKTLPIDLLMKKEQGGKGFPVKLTGTIQSPQFGLQ